MAGNRRNRLEGLERKLADLVRQEELANCNCQTLTFARSIETFEAEMNKNCPAHGFRRLGRIITVSVVQTQRTEGKDAKHCEEERALVEVVDRYERRLAQVEQAEEEQEYGRLEQ
jgi:hypothetical protein